MDAHLIGNGARTDALSQCGHDPLLQFVHCFGSSLLGLQDREMHSPTNESYMSHLTCHVRDISGEDHLS